MRPELRSPAPAPQHRLRATLKTAPAIPEWEGFMFPPSERRSILHALARIDMASEDIGVLREIQHDP